MSFWFLIWLFLSLTLMIFFVWMLFVIYRQKKGWRFYAQKRGLRYVKGAFSEPPQMEGMIDGYNVSFFPAHYELGDVRHSRKMTAIEVTLKTQMPFDGFVASGMLVDAVRLAALPVEYRPDHEGWPVEAVVATNDEEAMRSYLGSERLAMIVKWIRRKNVWFLLGCRSDVFLLRIDTPLPLDNPKVINGLVKSILKDVAALEVADADLHMLRMAGDLRRSQAPAVVEAQDLDASVGGALQLEGDGSDVGA